MRVWASIGVLGSLLPQLASCEATSNGVIYFSPPVAPKILSLTTSGNGCPSDTPETKSANWNEWTFNFNNFVARDTADAAARERNANCQIYISIASGPAGWQVAIKSLIVRSSAFLSQNSSITATGSAAAFLVSASDDGPIPRSNRNATFVNDRKEDVSGPITVRFDFGEAGPWSNCMGPEDEDEDVAGVISLNFRVAVKKTGAKGVATFGSPIAPPQGAPAGEDGAPASPMMEQLEWIWRRCVPAPATTTARRTRASSTRTAKATSTRLDEDIGDDFEITVTPTAAPSRATQQPPAVADRFTGISIQTTVIMAGTTSASRPRNTSPGDPA
jgi:hypothetical protein